MNDFLLEDIMTPVKKKKNGQSKGKRTERSLAKLFSERFNQPFSRTVGSGNRTSQVNLSEQAKNLYSGDLVVPEGFKWTLECKGGYPEIDLNSIFSSGNSKLNGFLEQAEKDSKICKRKPMLLWKQNRKEWLAFIKTNELDLSKFQYRLQYRDWSCVSLTELLKESDSFFKSSKI